MDPSTLLVMLLKGTFEAADFLIEKTKKKETVSRAEWVVLFSKKFEELVPEEPGE